MDTACSDPEIRVWAYSEDQWPPQTLAYIYTLMVDENLPAVFWHGGVTPSLNAFIRFYSDSSRMLFFPMLHEDKESINFDHIIGMAWIDEVELHRAAAHFWIRKSFRTKSAWRKNIPLRTANAVLSTIFLGAPTLQVLLCRMNKSNHVGVGFMKRIGVHLMGEIPRWYKNEEQYHDAVIGYILREDILLEGALICR